MSGPELLKRVDALLGKMAEDAVELELRRARHLEWISRVCGLCGLMLAGVRLVDSGWRHPTTLCLLAASLCFLVIPPALLFYRRTDLAALSLPAVALLALLGIAASNQGLYSEAMYWIPFVPLVASLFLRKYGALSFTGVTLAAICALFWLQWKGLFFAGVGSKQTLFLHFISLSNAAFFGGVLGWLYEHARRRTMSGLLKERHRKDEFIALLSHELRTPLTSVMGALQLLDHTEEEALTSQGRHLLDIANRNAQQLHKLISDLLDFQRIELDMYELSNETRRALSSVNESIEEHRLFASQKQIDLVLEHALPSNCQVHLDHGVLRQVLGQLLSNAIKFSPEQTEVRIWAELQGPELLLTIADQGEGIPIEYQSDVFRTFTQVEEHSTRSVGGLGIGLSLCQRLVQQMGGQLTFQSTEGEGTTFTLRLPEAQATAPLGLAYSK